ncbi:hydrogenase maturation protease [bacterium]|nr:hydrogenase maturation protease [bacterium]
MNRMLVAAVGGELATDDAVGLHVLRRLQAVGGYPDADLLDAGTAGFDLVARLSQYERAVILDAALLGAPPGTVRAFTPADYRPKRPAPLSGHTISLDSVLSAARYLDVNSELLLVGIQPSRVTPGYGLSPEMQALLPRITAEVDAIIRRQLLTGWMAPAWHRPFDWAQGSHSGPCAASED